MLSSSEAQSFKAACDSKYEEELKAAKRPTQVIISSSSSLFLYLSIPSMLIIVLSYPHCQFPHISLLLCIQTTQHLQGRWSKFVQPKDITQPIDTGVKVDSLVSIANKSVECPSDLVCSLSKLPIHPSIYLSISLSIHLSPLNFRLIFYTDCRVFILDCNVRSVSPEQKV